MAHRDIIQRFARPRNGVGKPSNGSAPLAEGLGLSLRTVNHWWRVDKIPESRFDDIVALARKKRINLKRAELESV